ncbi:putative LRR receptor-like serine/threonine-protein kinase-like [Capsicum annuum]|nr:putative LRR receptor-like serine/threonine-protein kinase-like [Capsicum annuum]KAF3627927.1 putative LRR receptor-like serine/threonine-protein kinase-like [Capsicum annuum]
MSVSVSGVLFPFMFFVLFMSFLGAPISQAKGSEMVPLIEPVKAEKMMMMMLNNTRRKLGSFQICALCTCCGGAKAEVTGFEMWKQSLAEMQGYVLPPTISYVTQTLQDVAALIPDSLKHTIF